MSDISRLIINKIMESLKILSQTGVGYIDSESDYGVIYQIDNRQFLIEIKEIDKRTE